MSKWTMVISGGNRHGGKSEYSKYYDMPVVLISPRGEILMTPCTFEMLGSPKSVHLYVNPQDYKFAIGVAGEDEQNIFIT